MLNQKISDYFYQFWKLYPKKVNRFKAFEAFKKIEKSRPEVIPSILKGLEKYIEYIRSESIEKPYILHASTFLNQQRWEDEYDIQLKTQAKSVNEVMKEKGIDQIEWERRYAEQKERNKKLYNQH